MFDFLRAKPKIALPANFLRTAFQVGTTLYQQDSQPAKKIGVVMTINEAIEDIHPFASGALERLESPTEFKSGYFCNSRGGFVAYCNYDNPTLFHLNRKSSAFVIGSLGNNFVSDTFFSFIGAQHPEVLFPLEMSIADDNSSQGLPQFQKINKGNQIDVIQAFEYANQCFLRVLTNQPINPKEIYKNVSALNYTQLTESYRLLQDRVMGTLENEIQISDNVPLNTYLTGPVI